VDAERDHLFIGGKWVPPAEAQPPAEGVDAAEEEPFVQVCRGGSADVDAAVRAARLGTAFNPMAPFGGYERSGIGRELGRRGSRNSSS
jgi:acyl-CoA reductase-like NAD-dependent aldehyde dehydrogenase